MTISQKLKDNRAAGKQADDFMERVYEHEPGLIWKEKSGKVILDMEHTGFFHLIAQKFFGKPRVSHISLDRYGSTLWLALDGERAVRDVLGVMEEAFPKEKETMQGRVLLFFRTLKENKLIREAV